MQYILNSGHREVCSSWCHTPRPKVIQGHWSPGGLTEVIRYCDSDCCEHSWRVYWTTSLKSTHLLSLLLSATTAQQPATRTYMSVLASLIQRIYNQSHHCSLFTVILRRVFHSNVCPRSVSPVQQVTFQRYKPRIRLFIMVSVYGLCNRLGPLARTGGSPEKFEDTWAVPWQKYGMSLAIMGSHNVTCHPTQANIPP